MKNYYLIIQIENILSQIYVNGDNGVKELRYTIKRISEELLESNRKQKLDVEELVFEKMQKNNPPTKEIGHLCNNSVDNI